MEFKTRESQLKASAAYKKRNASKARLPGSFLDDDIAAKLESLAVLKGSKIKAINEAIILLYDKEFGEKDAGS